MQLTIEKTFNTPIVKVWKAITETEKLQQWYFNITELKLETGFEFRFSAGNDENHQYLHICKIIEAIPEKKLSYSWRFDNYQGMSYLSFELLPSNNLTRLKLIHEGLETFPSDNPDFSKESFEEGWNYIIGTSLREFLEKD